VNPRNSPTGRGGAKLRKEIAIDGKEKKPVSKEYKRTRSLPNFLAQKDDET